MKIIAQSKRKKVEIREEINSTARPTCCDLQKSPPHLVKREKMKGKWVSGQP